MRRPKLKILFGIVRILLIAGFLLLAYEELYVNRLQELWAAKASLDDASEKLIFRLKKRSELESFENEEAADFRAIEELLSQRIPGEPLDQELDTLVDEAGTRAEITVLSVVVRDAEPAFNNVKALSAQLASQNEEFQRIPFTVKASGRTRNLALFLGLLLESERLVRLERAQMERGEALFPDVTTNLELYAYFRKIDAGKGKKK
jgi:hypothetical protein